jgi:chemotaxis protein MotA
MDLGTVGGLLLGLLAIFGSFLLEGGTMGSLILLPAMIIVFLGTFATALIGVSMKTFLSMSTLMKIAMFGQERNLRETIERLVNYAYIIRREGILALESQIATIKDPFLRKGIQLMIDGSEQEYIKEVMELELDQMTERHMKGAQMFSKMGGFSPTMGIIGTVMGLITTLGNAGEDPNELIHHIAGAFIATLWGVFNANIIWLPIGDKLKFRHNEEMEEKHMILVGILSMQAGENPGALKLKLESFLPESAQDLEGKGGKPNAKEAA